MTKNEAASLSVPSSASPPSDSVSFALSFRVRRRGGRPRLGLTFIVLAITCVFVTIAMCSPHHRVRHHHGHHYYHHVSNRSEVEDTTPTTKADSPAPNTDADASFNGPPAYLTLMYESLASHSKSVRRRKAGDTANTEPIVRALLAAEIADSAAGTKISFSLSKKSLGEFNRANIILTLKDEVSLSDDGSVLAIVVSMKDFQVQHSLTIREGSKFYSFDVTKLIKSKMATTGSLTKEAVEAMATYEEEAEEAAEALQLECTMMESEAQSSGRTRRFSEIFSLDTEAPFILLRFQHVHLSSSVDVGIIQTTHPQQQEGVKNTEHWEIGNRRRRRSASESAPTTETGIPETTSQSSHANGECTCPSTPFNLRDTSPFLPFDDQSPANHTEERGNGSRRGNDVHHDEYEVTPINYLPQVNLTLPNRSRSRENKTKSANEISGHFSHNSVSGKHQSFGFRKLSLDEPAVHPTPPHPSRVPPSPTVCKRHEWLVRPSDISLQGVLKPEYLDLGFCGGTCPYPLQNDVYNYTLHSYFADQHRFFNNFATPVNLPHSRCVPVTYKRLMVLTKEADGGFAVIVYDDASVEACGCR